MNYQKIKAMSTKGLTKDLINKFRILKKQNIFLQNLLVYIPAKK